MRLLQQAGEENSTGGAAADTTVPPVGEPIAGAPATHETMPGGDLIADSAAAKSANEKPPPPNPAERIQEQAERAAAANAHHGDGGKRRDDVEGDSLRVNPEHEAVTATMDGKEVVAAMRRSLIEFESALALGTHEIAHEARAFLAHCAEKLKRHIPS